MCFPMEWAVEKKWDFAGFQCVVTRGDLLHPKMSLESLFSAHRCGYVRVPEGHPWHGKDYNDLQVRVHGDLTFSEKESCAHEDGVGHWFGFDCGHAGDARFPAGDTRDPQSRLNLGHRYLSSGHYWTLEEVQAETEKLATQAMEAVK